MRITILLIVFFLFGCSRGASPVVKPADRTPSPQEEKRDIDGDQVYTPQDLCPCVAEDLDGFEDEDGCPDHDNDHDGFSDGQDECPNKAGTHQGCDYVCLDCGVTPQFSTVPFHNALGKLHPLAIEQVEQWVQVVVALTGKIKFKCELGVSSLSANRWFTYVSSLQRSWTRLGAPADLVALTIHPTQSESKCHVTKAGRAKLTPDYMKSRPRTSLKNLKRLLPPTTCRPGDIDNDGVPNDRDLCVFLGKTSTPSSKLQAWNDKNGCPNFDIDLDGTCNHLDDFPKYPGPPHLNGKPKHQKGVCWATPELCHEQPMFLFPEQSTTLPKDQRSQLIKRGLYHVHKIHLFADFTKGGLITASKRFHAIRTDLGTPKGSIVIGAASKQQPAGTGIWDPPPRLPMTGKAYECSYRDHAKKYDTRNGE